MAAIAPKLSSAPAGRESWRHVWRRGFAPQLSLRQLDALRQGLEADDPRLMQACTTSPPPLECVSDWPCEGACLIGYCGWQGDGLATVAEVEEYFARACYECDQLLGEPAACRWLLDWYDATPREEMRRELLAEVELAIANLTKGAA